MTRGAVMARERAMTIDFSNICYYTRFSNNCNIISWGLSPDRGRRSGGAAPFIGPMNSSENQTVEVDRSQVVRYNGEGVVEKPHSCLWLSPVAKDRSAR